MQPSCVCMLVLISVMLSIKASTKYVLLSDSKHIHCKRLLLPKEIGITSITVGSDMEFLEVLTEGLERVLLVRGGGREVITIYS